jgi:hypothetical protein
MKPSLVCEARGAQGPVDPGRSQLYHVAGQSPDVMQAVVIRGPGDPSAYLGPAREALRAVDPQVAMFDVLKR